MSIQLILPMISEEWRSVVGELYEVSNLGGVRRSRPRGDGHKPGQLSPVVRSSGYPTVCLYKDKRRRDIEVHALVANAFIQQRPAGWEVNHRDGNKENNTVTNLEYLTHSENQRHAFVTGLTPPPPH